MPAKCFPCGECGQMVTASQSHTYEDCLSFKAKRMGDSWKSLKGV